jgi:hypothetical protein
VKIERERQRGMKGDGKEIEVTLRSDEFDADYTQRKMLVGERMRWAVGYDVMKGYRYSRKGYPRVPASERKKGDRDRSRSSSQLPLDVYPLCLLQRFNQRPSRFPAVPDLLIVLH